MMMDLITQVRATAPPLVLYRINLRDGKLEAIPTKEVTAYFTSVCIWGSKGIPDTLHPAGTWLPKSTGRVLLGTYMAIETPLVSMLLEQSAELRKNQGILGGNWDCIEWTSPMTNTPSDDVGGLRFSLFKYPDEEWIR